MRLKSFFAATVEAALAEGSRELGPDAVIVQSGNAPPELRHRGRYEVVLGTAPLPATGTPTPEPLARELADLRRQIDGMRQSLSRGAMAAPRWLAPSSQSGAIYNLLVASEVEPNLAQQVAEQVSARLGPAAAEAELVRQAAAAEMESRFGVDATLGRDDAAQRVVALVGPPGAGKTTTLVKLAVVYGLAARRPVALISADSYHATAADELRAYAAILGVSFEMAATPVALAQALRAHGSKELILIDTPGLAVDEMDCDLAPYFASQPEIESHLVLSASMKSADITRAVDRFEIFRPAKLLFTRLDETEALGPVWSEAVRTSKPVSFLATGQQIPEHLEPATKSRIVGLVLPPEATRWLAAA